MSLKFNLTYNTPSDWVKAIAAGVTAGIASFTTANLDGQVNGGEWVGILTAAALAFATVLGFYSGANNPQAPTNLEPRTDSQQDSVAEETS